MLIIDEKKGQSCDSAVSDALPKTPANAVRRLKDSSTSKVKDDTSLREISRASILDSFDKIV
jgi:hypothetical protein